MMPNLIHDRGRGPELIGTRTTIYNLLPYFLDPTATEEYICRVCELTPEQVAAARAYAFHHSKDVLAEHRRIEERIAKGNAPAVVEVTRQTHARFLDFKNWLADRERARVQNEVNSAREGELVNRSQFPSFDEWLAERESTRAEGQ